jgi:hypothetical protein
VSSLTRIFPVVLDRTRNFLCTKPRLDLRPALKLDRVAEGVANGAAEQASKNPVNLLDVIPQFADSRHRTSRSHDAARAE